MIALLGGTSDLAKLVVHLHRNSDESGRDGDVIFRPRSVTEPFDEIAARERHRACWARKPGEPSWARTWGLVVGGQIRGHADLHGGLLPSEQHRTTLGIGLERPWRGQGHGRELLEAAIGWARAQRFAWLDLGVFAQNAAARALYQKLGFVEVGITRDRFRVDGVIIDDVQMTLELSP
jgi:ribosomal protein S18 acetylase RimI-like enzyme